MTEEEIKQKLHDAGIPESQWKPSSSAKPRLLEGKRDFLVQLEELIAAQINKDQSEIGGLLGDLSRIRHGGGS